MWSDLALGPSFKVKQWFTYFDEVSFSVDTNLHRFSDVLGVVHVRYLDLRTCST